MKRISRRNFLKVAGVGAAALSLAACGGAASSTAPSTASSAASAAAEDVTIKVAAIETGYGAEMWKKVPEAFTAQTGIKVIIDKDMNYYGAFGNEDEMPLAIDEVTAFQRR